MMTEEREGNLALVRAVVDQVMNGGDTTRAYELFAPDYVWYPADGVSGPMDVATHMKDFAQLREAFPDFRVHIDEMYADGDRVITRFAATATHQAPLQKAVGHIIAPSNRSLNWKGVTIHRIENGRIAEGWITYDRASIDEQIGWRR